MHERHWLERVVRAAVRRPGVTVAVVLVLALAGGLAALHLRPRSDPDTLVSSGAGPAKATAALHSSFGDDAVYVLVRGELSRILLTADLQRLLGLEGCIAGNVPRGVVPPGGRGGPCAALARTKPVKVVYGPGTFVNESVNQIQDELTARQRTSRAQAQTAATAARRLAAAKGYSKPRQDQLAKRASQLVQAQFVRDLAQAAYRYGLTGVPRLDDAGFVTRLVFDPSRGYNQPKARFAYLFPSKDAALVQVRLRPGLSDGRRREAIALVRRATAMPAWRLQTPGASYAVTGAPVVLSDLTSSITDSLVKLLLAALLVMAAALALVFRTRARLLPLAVALAAAGLAFGAMALVGAPLTMASVAVLPVLIGLAVDYAIQLQARFREEERPGRDPAEAAVAAARSGAPTIATAAGATVAGFLVLQLSPVPMVRGFGLLLVAGVVVAFACALTAGFAALVLLGRGAAGLPAALRAPARALGAAIRGAGELVGALVSAARGALSRLPVVRGGAGAVRRAARATLAVSLRRPATVLLVASALAVVGWVAGTQTRVVSDVPKLVPQDTGSLRDLERLQASTGVAGEVDVLVQADDVTRPAVVGWMADYQREVLSRAGYSRTRPCGTATLCPSFSLPDLLAGAASGTTGARRIRAIIDAVPPYFSRAVVTPDRRTATLAFGIRLMPLDQQQRVLEDMRSRLDAPPGVTARLAGLPVLAAQANADVSSGWRRALMLVAGLLAVLAVLLLVWRRLERALVPVLPIALATGWSAGVLVLVGVPLNPLSVTLGALVIAIATEFSVLLSERYRQERAARGATAEALRATYRSTGVAVLASGTTAIAGFAVLVLSDIRMVRDFGLVTVIDLSVALAGVLLVLPAVIVLSERGELLGLPRLAARRAWDARPRPRRSRAAA